MSLQPLKGIRVLDLSKVLAGPLCGQYLGELSADVIKVEPAGLGDDTRLAAAGAGPVGELSRRQPQQAQHCAGPEAGGRARRRPPARRAERCRAAGLRLGAATRLGVDHETLRGLNPRLIYCEISGYGRDGPLGDLPGYDVMLQAFSGMVSTMGDPHGDYARASFSPVDLGTGMHALSGVLAALLERGRTGQGVFLEVALLDTALGFMGYQAQNYWCSGVVPKRMGTAHPAMSPYQAFRASDGVLFIGVGNDAQWRRFCEAAGLMDHVEQEAFATNAQRVANFDRTVQLVQQRMEQEPVRHWLHVLRRAKVPCAPVHQLDEALAHPQVAARKILVESRHPVLGEIHNVGLPVRFEGQSRQALRPPPLLGEHAAEVLREAGYSPTDIDALLACGAVGTFKPITV